MGLPRAASPAEASLTAVGWGSTLPRPARFRGLPRKCGQAHDLALDHETLARVGDMFEFVGVLFQECLQHPQGKQLSKLRAPCPPALRGLKSHEHLLWPPVPQQLESFLGVNARHRGARAGSWAERRRRLRWVAKGRRQKRLAAH